MDNYQQVLLQMQEFGIEFRDKDLPLELDTPKSKTCGKGGKDWYKLYLFRRDPEKGGGTYVVGTELKLSVALLLIIGVLIVKPSGLLGKTIVTRV